MEKTLIAPSILSGDFSKMGEEIARIDRAGADLIHCDVMDGVFVPNISFGPKMIADIRKSTKLPLDVHLMIIEPERYIDNFIDAGADYLTIHVEATKKAEETLKRIRNSGVKSGIVISPDTPVEAAKGLFEHSDMVLLMSVYPGFGGQKYIEKSTQRLTRLKEIAKKENPSILIEIDGGINFENAQTVKKAGAEVLVAGSTVFSAPDIKAAIERLRG